mmetsp:Transcript_23153/g.48082  ORF Transcript_23153/g.48082 Transcript_23153/m.48082 type:complete len:182 (-) Transcript_23153:168-713(-)|eukprot:CAMPEP_0171431918 /NCGR_PEP_ID=MMETSP0881-20121228/7561_1 /TAXON_ID=67004 /ORGANISM="Thalassiosira weissflogii, Strain CCMP1336" /LENGTH=181 /DNA_ID=CAMNT_0011952293 /DNA_START=28 /DNA_END=573 /DNA_ORIENTATION=-
MNITKEKTRKQSSRPSIKALAHLPNEADIDNAIAFFRNGKKKEITPTSIHERFKLLRLDVKLKDIRAMTGESESLSKEAISKLLSQKQHLQKCDPVDEIFMSLCNTFEDGVINEKNLRTIMRNLGCGDLSDGEVRRLMNVVDRDRDGAIGLEDFRGLSLLQKEIDDRNIQKEGVQSHSEGR